MLECELLCSAYPGLHPFFHWSKSRSSLCKHLLHRLLIYVNSLFCCNPLLVVLTVKFWKLCWYLEVVLLVTQHIPTIIHKATQRCPSLGLETCYILRSASNICASIQDDSFLNFPHRSHQGISPWSLEGSHEKHV